jgi:hypothetical protein
MGLGLGDFLDLTPFAWMGIKNRFLQYSAKADQERWEMTRWLAFRIACPPEPKTKGGRIGVTDFIRFPWEDQHAIVQPGKDEAAFRRAVERYK